MEIKRHREERSDVAISDITKRLCYPDRHTTFAMTILRGTSGDNSSLFHHHQKGLALR